MGVKSFLSKPLAAEIVRRQKRWSENPGDTQRRVFKKLIRAASETQFGRDHDFKTVKTHDDFKKRVPIKDYEALSPYIKKIIAGESDVLWKGRPIYLSETSGTTSGVKFIPVTSDSIDNHINGARNALLNYIHKTKKSKFIDGKMIFLSGSPELHVTGGIQTGRLSGIVNHHVPGYLRKNQLPSYKTNCIDDWEEKLDRIVEETLGENMTLISGIPPWVQMYFDRLIERTGKKIKDIFPNFSVFVYGGVNFEPYRAKLTESVGKAIDSIELYPASEGFLAFQDTFDSEGMLLLLNSGIFYEFIPADEFFSDDPSRLMIDEVETGVNYAVIINSNAGLWGYSLGDTVKFVSKKPYRVIVTGRIKHFISAFGEHVIGEEVEKALKFVSEKFPEAEVTEFTVAPVVTPVEGLPHHEWLMEFAAAPKDVNTFAALLDEKLCELNHYYADLIKGSILRPLKITLLPEGSFIQYMKSVGKLGGQNKVPRLCNDRIIADQLAVFS